MGCLRPLGFPTVRGARVAVVLAMAFLVGCGENTDGESLRVSLSGFAKATTHGVSARYVTTTVADERDQGGPPIRAVGVFDFEQSSGTVHYDESLGPDAVVVRGVVYIPMTDMGTIEREDPCYGREYGSFDYPRYEKEGLGVEADSVSPVPFDPGQVTASLERSEATLTKVGADEVRGVPTTRYRVAIDGARLDARFASDSSQDQALVGFEVWVDREQQLRRARWTVKITWGSSRAEAGLPDLPDQVTPPWEGGTYHETTTVELWDYGVAVNVEAPPEDEVCDFPDFFGRTMATFD